MIIFLIIFFLYILPLWFLFRYYYFDEYMEGEELAFGIVLTLIISWIGFSIVVLMDNDESDAIRETFFLPPKRDQSLNSKIFWYKIRVLLLRLLFIKEK